METAAVKAACRLASVFVKAILADKPAMKAEGTLRCY